MQQQASSTDSAPGVHGRYFPHIDGIRALAVLPVVLFHILAMLCPGGFVGVDVFFVISGYLITGGILRDLAKDRFTIRAFYYRRIRRIMPAYFAMILGVFAVGCALYYSTPLIYFGDAVTAGTLFFANIHFWDMAGDYFAPQIHSQALLHLWSLSVEEQFYFFIPLICAVIWKLRRRWIAPVFSMLAVASLGMAVHAVLAGKQSYAFYLLPFRAWELLAGSLLAMIPAVACAPADRSPDRKTSASSGKRHSFFALTGLLMVLIPYAVMSSSTPFPDLTAASSVLGTVLLIRYGQSGWVSRILSWRPFVATGKISYSLYLWHWPVTVFWRYATYDQLCIYDYIGMFLLSVILGYLSWRFVELPVRTSSFWTMRRSFAFATAGIVLLATLGAACSYYKGWPTLLHPQANLLAGASTPPQGVRIQSFLRRIDAATGARFSFLHKNIQKREAVVLDGGGNGSSVIGDSGQPLVFLVGDSHAGSLRHGLDTVLREKNLAGYAVVCSSTTMFDMNLPETKAALKKLNEMPTVSAVILAELWQRYHEDGIGAPM